MWVATAPPGRGACRGDSGGPLTVARVGQHTLAGVVSWAAGCAVPGLPGVYAAVPRLVDWVTTTVAANGGIGDICNASGSSE